MVSLNFVEGGRDGGDRVASLGQGRWGRDS